MAGIKISEATLRSALQGTENLPIVDTDLVAGRTTIDDIKDYVQPDLSDYVTDTELSTTLADYAKTTDVEEAISESLEGENLVNIIEDYCSYGIQFDTTVSSPTCTRIGNTELHQTLPVQSKMRGCLLADDGTVNQYLDESDWTSETRDGTAGQVMVEIPEHYMKFETEGTVRRVKISDSALPGFTKIAKYYISAYEASVQRSTLKLCSVVNEDTDYRGGNNTESWDGTYRSLLGMPATYISRTNFRTYARNRNDGDTQWNCMTYSAQKDLYWLFVTEYATLNTQATFNESKDANGYSQGGLGNGVTTLNYDTWNTYNTLYPFIPCGYTDSLGNGTGQISFTMPTEYDESTTTTVYVPRYRGIENPFGHVWKWTDGVNIRISPTSDNGGDDLSKIFVCNVPSKFSDTDYTGYEYIGDLARTSAYIKEIIFGENGEILPSVTGGSSSTYFCDYNTTSIPETEILRGVHFGGSAVNGSYAGLVHVSSSNAPSDASAYIGSRLCFIPE